VSTRLLDPSRRNNLQPVIVSCTRIGWAITFVRSLSRLQDSTSKSTRRRKLASQIFADRIVDDFSSSDYILLFLSIVPSHDV
jgi:hypothetical protein